MNTRKYSKAIIIILTLVCISLTFALLIIKNHKLKKNSNINLLNDKILSEIEYIDSNIIEAMNKLNNISMERYKVYTKKINISEDEDKSSNNNEEKGKTSNSNKKDDESNKDSDVKKDEQIQVSQLVPTNFFEEINNSSIEWKNIATIYENLYTTWPTLRMDLQKDGILDENLERYSLCLNGIAQSINAENKNICLINFYNLYSQLPAYISKITNNAYTINLYNTKLNVLNAYTLANNEKWEEMNVSILSCKSTFSNIINSINNTENIIENYERVNLMLDDLQKSINLNDKKIFYMNYKNVMQELENL